MKHNTSIEPLEPRIAPATISIVGKTATWTDFDGDQVTMKWTSADAPTFTTMDQDAGLLVSRISLEAAKHDGASFTVKVKAAGTFGDGRVELGHLDAVDVSLKSWVGPKAAISEVDLGKVQQAGIGTLSMGGLGQTHHSFFTGAMGNGNSFIRGGVKTLKINGDLSNGTMTMQPGTGQQVGSFTITGSIRGDIAGGGAVDGAVDFFGGGGSGGSVFIGGSIENGRLSISGLQMKTVTIAGDVVGATAFPSSNGAVYVSADKLTVLGSVLGGQVQVAAGTNPIQSVLIGGSIVARDGVQESGTLYIHGSAKNVTVKGSLRGAEFATFVDGASSFDPISGAGAVLVDGNVGTLNIGGNIHSGKIANGNLGVNGGIQVKGNIGTIAIKGSVIGNDRMPVYILAGGSGAGATTDYNGIGKLSIKGDVIHAFIAAGTRLANDSSGSALILANNPDAGIGSVLIGKNFNTSNIFAGVLDGGSPGVNPINMGDTLAVGDPVLTAKLGPVVIKGHLLSDRDSAYYAGFTADVIASITVAGRKVFTAGDGLRNFDDYITAKEL